MESREKSGRGKMRYQGLKDGKIVELPVRFTRAPGVEEVYAHGAAGGHVANYHFRIDFYKDEFPPVEFTVLGNRIVEGEGLTIQRKVVASVCVPLPFLKELRNWMNTRIEEIETEQGEIALPKKDTSEETLPEVKEA